LFSFLSSCFATTLFFPLIISFLSIFSSSFVPSFHQPPLSFFSILFLSYSPSTLSHNCEFQSETQRDEFFPHSLGISSNAEISLTRARCRLYT
jgi:hypothetical protein